MILLAHTHNSLGKSTAKEAAKVSLSNNVPILDSIVAATAKLMACHFVLSDDSDLKKLHQKNISKLNHGRNYA